MTATLTATATRTKRITAPRIGVALSTASVLFLLFDTVSHLTKPAVVVESFHQLGFPVGTAVTVGVLELICVALYAIPRTAVLGAILVTAYLGGAFCAQFRVEASVGELLFSVATAVVVWAGVYLRRPALRTALGVDILAR